MEENSEKIPRFVTMPKCEYHPTAMIRIYREEIGEPGSVFFRTVDTLEMMYLDGYEKPFWGPVPIVKGERHDTDGSERQTVHGISQRLP